MSKEILELINNVVKRIESNISVESNRENLIELLSYAVDSRQVTHEFAQELDERLGLNVFC